MAVFAAGDTEEGMKWAKNKLGSIPGVTFVSLPGASVHSSQTGGAQAMPEALSSKAGSHHTWLTSWAFICTGKPVIIGMVRYHLGEDSH